MAILIIDTYERGVFESLSTFTDESLGDRTDFQSLPAAGAEVCKRYVASGAIPSTRQPTDSFVVTDEHVIVTFTWFDRAAAEEYQTFKSTQVRPGLVSSELVER
jgi:hypothetical protein